MNIKSILLCATVLASFALGFAASEMRRSGSETLLTGVLHRDDARRIERDGWSMDIYTGSKTVTYGTERMFTAIADIDPGKSVHPAHRHAEEEFLLVTAGTGKWSVNGRESPARAGDLLYAAPWDMHGLVNTGDEPLTFFVIKWENQGVPSPPESTGDHGS